MCDNIDLIAKIKFISKIKQGEKINTKAGFFIQNDSLISRISRSFYYQDTRTNTITFISDTLIQVFHLLKLYMTTSKISDITMCINVIEDINNMKKGIINLQQTYQDDAIIVSKLETFVQEIDSKLLEFKKNNTELIINPGIFVSTSSEHVPDVPLSVPTLTEMVSLPPEPPTKIEKHKLNPKKQ